MIKNKCGNQEMDEPINENEINAVHLIYNHIKARASRETDGITPWIKERIDSPDRNPLFCTEDLQLTYIDQALKQPVVENVFTDPVNQALIDVALKSMILVEKRLCVPTATRHDESLMHSLKVMSGTLGLGNELDSDSKEHDANPAVSALHTEVNYYRAIAKKMTEDLASTANLLNRYKEDVHIGRSIHSVLSECIDTFDLRFSKIIKSIPFYQQDIILPINPYFSLNECPDDKRINVPHAKLLKEAGINNLHDLAMLTNPDYFNINGIGYSRRSEIGDFIQTYLPLSRALFNTGALTLPTSNSHGDTAIPSTYAKNLRMKRNYEWTVPKALRPTLHNSDLAVLDCNLAHYDDSGNSYQASIFWREKKA